MPENSSIVWSANETKLLQTAQILEKVQKMTGSRYIKDKSRSFIIKQKQIKQTNLCGQ